jgi:DNA polymerase IIIc chi subunit
MIIIRHAHDDEDSTVSWRKRGSGEAKTVSGTIASVAQLELHPLNSPKRARQLVELLDRLHRERRRVVVWVSDEGRRQILDDYLWTFEKLAFVPHSLWGTELGEVDDPIVLVGEAVNPNRATVLVVGDDPPPGAWAATFDEVHDLIVPGESGERRTEFWERWKMDPENADVTRGHE